MYIHTYKHMMACILYPYLCIYIYMQYLYPILQVNERKWSGRVIPKLLFQEGVVDCSPINSWGSSYSWHNVHE